jgi:hypothetical protein
MCKDYCPLLAQDDSLVARRASGYFSSPFLPSSLHFLLFALPYALPRPAADAMLPLIQYIREEVDLGHSLRGRSALPSRQVPYPDRLRPGGLARVLDEEELVDREQGRCHLGSVRNHSLASS